MRLFWSLPFLAASVAAHAQFYGGDSDGTTDANGSIAYLSGRNGTSLVWCYDDFDHSGQQVSGVFGNFYLTTPGLPTIAHYEIRSGLGLATLGTLIASGTALPNFVATGRSGFGADEYQVSIDGLAIDLAAGSYHMGIYLDHSFTAGAAFVSVTRGLDAGPAGDPNPAPHGSPIDNGNALRYFVSTALIATLGDPDSDLSYGVTVNPVPEPASLIAMGAGLAFLSRRRRP